MRLVLFLAFISFGIINLPNGAFAQSINPDMLITTEACTTPRPVPEINPNDERWKYCDIHMRQFEYRERVIELREKLNTRAENFKASTKPIHENYKIELQKYHDSLGAE